MPNFDLEGVVMSAAPYSNGDCSASESEKERSANDCSAGVVAGEQLRGGGVKDEAAAGDNEKDSEGVRGGTFEDLPIMAQPALRPQVGDIASVAASAAVRATPAKSKVRTAAAALSGCLLQPPPSHPEPTLPALLPVLAA